jgi:hypothetical protein
MYYSKYTVKYCHVDAKDVIKHSTVKDISLKMDFGYYR